MTNKRKAYAFPMQGLAISDKVHGYPNGIMVVTINDYGINYHYCVNKLEAQAILDEYDANPTQQFYDGLNLWEKLSQ